MPRVIGFHYTLRDDLGGELDSSAGGDPLYFLEGAGQIIPGLERQLADVRPGERRTIAVKAAEAYGDVNPDLVVKVNRSQFPPHAALELGDSFTVDAGENGPVFTIIDSDADTVTVDGNHPMAGKDLHFEVEIVGVREATTEEVAHGHAHGPEGQAHH